MWALVIRPCRLCRRGWQSSCTLLRGRQVLRDEQGRCKGGFVNFANRVSAQSAIASLHGTPSGVPGESLAVSLQARRQHRPSPQPMPTPPPEPLQ